MGALDEGPLGAIRGALGDALGRDLVSPRLREAIKAELQVLPRGARYTLPWMLRARGRSDQSLLKVTLDNARIDPLGLALEMGDERYTWSDLDRKTSQVAYVLAASGVRKGDVVALLGLNSPLYVAIILGASRLGATVALVNSHLAGHPLSHAVKASGARVAVVEASCSEALGSRPDLKAELETILTFREGDFEQRGERERRLRLHLHLGNDRPTEAVQGVPRSLGHRWGELRAALLRVQAR